MTMPMMATLKNTVNMARLPIRRFIHGTIGMNMNAGTDPKAMKLAIWLLVP